jgi:hypothetical protein
MDPKFHVPGRAISCGPVVLFAMHAAVTPIVPGGTTVPQAAFEGDVVYFRRLGQ